MIDDDLKDTLVAPDDSMNTFIYNFAEVERDVSNFCTPENEVLGVEHFLVEPECNKDLIGGVLRFDAFDSQKCFNVENFSCAIEYDQIKIDSDALDSYLTGKGEATKLEFLDGMLQGIDEGVTNEKKALPRAREAYLSDAINTNDILKSDYGPCKESRLRNMDLEIHSPGFNERGSSNEEVGLTSSSIPVLESMYIQGYPLLDQMTVLELHEAFKSMFGRVTLVEDKQWLKRRILFGLQNWVELDNGFKPLECSVTSHQNERNSKFFSSNESSKSASCGLTGMLDNENMSRDGHVKKEIFPCHNAMETLSSKIAASGIRSINKEGMADTLVTHKRLRKPTKRYIEEPPVHKSRCYNRKYGISYKSSKDKIALTKPQKKHCQRGSGAAWLVSHEESLNVACIQVPFGLPIQEQRLEKKTSCLGHDSKDSKGNRPLGTNENFDLKPLKAESPGDTSEDDCVFINRKGRTRRKHHRSWTISEVMKLIEGVSKYGVGRWVEIKRLLFSSSHHRTSVDLKDKWRNLLKASCSQLRRREVDQGRKQASHQVPESILRSVSELAAIHPYPRGGKSKI